jgi:hypothetical protein
VLAAERFAAAAQIVLVELAPATRFSCRKKSTSNC